ncbi:MTA/SAH nucleosidase [Paenibacillus marchantiophytorum]|uniref:MTA/SAH nucleosidase n=1 Tax=Paenibacillus marchantiophytorum TaxID=1619310 RepID=A0ABQ2BR75_9BACL|nr:HAD family hydrolase [Paenibacillus marchantiophytorum]GGI44267.1 MTA/SAH nucleosidase [Paenibacillus marchantiophytorum]
MTIQRKQPEAMLFDLDGTLFQTETLLLPAYHATFDELRAKGLFTGETPPEERILGALGMLLEQIWQRVMPEASIEARNEADKLLLNYQMNGLHEGQGDLYEGVAETLQALRDKGIRLFVASNGLEDYVRNVIAAKGLGHLFEGLYSAGQYQTKSKVDLVQILLETHHIQSAWMVGDRSSDVEAGLRNHLTVAACDYAGFRESGELEGAHIRIRSFAELLEYV